MDKQIINEIKEVPMGDNDIKQYLPNAKILKYTDLAKVSNIEDILKKPRDFFILLYQDSDHTGHWCCVARTDKNTISFFDPYGCKISPDEELKWLDKSTRRQLGTNKPYLSQLFDKTDKKVKFNTIKYQQDHDTNAVQTCGRHCTFFLMNMLKGHNLDSYYNMMNELRNKLKKNYDDVVSIAISDDFFKNQF